jgi:hypothetical protein
MKKTIKLTQTKTFTKTSTIEIECPNHLELENVIDYLHKNQDLWWESLEWSTKRAELEYQPKLEDLRYDVLEITEKHLYGGEI